MTTTYAVYSCCDTPENAETGLTPAEVVRHIYTHDGKGFYLEPRMETPQDDDGNDLDERQISNHVLGKEWDVYFTRPGQNFGEKSMFTAYGEIEEAAETEFLLDAWKNDRWDDEKWIIVTDEQHATKLAQSNNEQEID